MTAQPREIWSKEDLLKVARRHKDLFWLLVMNFFVAFVCLGPILTVASRGIETRLKAAANPVPAGDSHDVTVAWRHASMPSNSTASAAAASQAATETNAPPSVETKAGDSAAVTNQPLVEAGTPPAAAPAAEPSLLDRAYRGLVGFGALLASLVTAGLSFVYWGYAIPGSIIISSLLTIFSNHRLATLVRTRAPWYFINPLLMLTAAAILVRYHASLTRAFADAEPWAYIVLVTLSMMSLGALFPLVRLDSAATSLLDRHGIAFGALGAKLSHFEPHDIRRYRCPRCQVDLLPEQEFWDGAHPKCIRCGTVGERLSAAGTAASANVSPAPAQ
jgi:hypothetical protein